MARKRINEAAIDELLELVDQERAAQQPPSTAPPPPEFEYRPPLGAAQQIIYDSWARYICGFGEKGSGKTYVLGGEKLVRHLWRNFNAHALLVMRVKGQGEGGGAWFKLTTQVLPEWERGQPGFRWEGPFMDTQRNESIDVWNKHGGWSRVTLLSEDHGPTFANKIRNYEPSYVCVDELTTMDPEFFSATVAQLGRRPGITDPQQFGGPCNPDDPEHWVHVKMHDEPLAEYVEYNDADEEIVTKPEGEWDPDFLWQHVPFTQNEQNLPPGYRSQVMTAYRGDRVMQKRMLHGIWEQRPSGEAIFKHQWSRELHVRGGLDTVTGQYRRFVPNPRYEIIVGYDLGSVNNAIVLMQCIPVEKRNVWVVFDEFTHLHRRIKYEPLIKKLLERFKYWQNVANGGRPFRMVHVVGRDAFDQFRPGQGGSYDVLEVQRICDEWCPKLGVERIQLRPAPQFRGSVQTRVRLTQNVLADQALLVGANCPHLIKAFEKLETEEQVKGKYDPELELTPRRSKHLHSFDAFSYPVLALEARMPGIRTGTVPMSVIVMGRGGITPARP